MHKQRLISTGIIGLVLIACSSLANPPLVDQPTTVPQRGSTSAAPGPGQPGNVETRWGKRTKTGGCIINGALPDPECTPGDIFPDVTKDEICQSGYSRTVRDVPQSVKDEVYAEYGIKSHVSGQYEVDHYISLELGGSNEISNLFPEAASPKPGFHEKDQVENYLHDQVCSGMMTLKQAQISISTNWLAVYQQMPK
jgi:hypothetical protein